MLISGRVFVFPAPTPDNPMRYDYLNPEQNNPEFDSVTFIGKHEYWLKSEDFRPAKTKET